MSTHRRSVVVAGSIAMPRRRQRLRLGLVVASVLVGSLATAVVAFQPSPDVPTATVRPKAIAAPEASRATAVQTAVDALDALSGSAITNRRRFAAAVERLSAPGTEENVRAVFGEADPKLVAAFRRQPSVLRFAPLGYRIDSYDERLASVAIWSVAIAGAAGEKPTSQWRTLVIDLAKTSRGWKVMDGAGVDGPSPSTAQPELATSAAGFRSFRYAP